MPLAGSGSLMGIVILSAIGNPDPKAVPVFGAMGDAIAAWSIANMSCTPGSMASAGAVVSGFGGFAALGSVADLGVALASAVGDVSARGIATWTAFAGGLVNHFQSFGQVDGKTFVAPTPGPGPLTGTAKVMFTSPVFIPPVASLIAVTDPVAAVSLELFGATILAHIIAQAVVVPVALVAPFIPYTSPAGGGTITGAGSMT